MENEIGEAYQKANLVVSRSGAHTTAELLALKKSCILIPIPWVSHNEQFENAKLLVDAGLGQILPEKDLSPQNLVDSIKIALGGENHKISRSGQSNQISQSSKSSKTIDVSETSSIRNQTHHADPAELIIQELMSIIKKDKDKNLENQ